MVKAIEPDDADVPQIHTHLTLIQPPLPPVPMPAVVKLLVERLRHTTNAYRELACFGTQGDMYTAESAAIRDANRQIVETMLGIPWADDEVES
jgi:hypothetical protein